MTSAFQRLLGGPAGLRRYALKKLVPPGYVLLHLDIDVTLQSQIIGGVAFFPMRLTATLVYLGRRRARQPSMVRWARAQFAADQPIVSPPP